MTYYAIDLVDDNKVKTIEFVRVTERYGFRPDGRRESLSSYDNWFPTREQAIEYRRNRLADEAGHARMILASREKMLAAFNALYPEMSKSPEDESKEASRA